MKSLNLVTILLVISILGCKKEDINTANDGVFKAESAGVTSGILAAKYTCDGSSVSPPINWTNAPSGTKSLAVVMHHIPPTGDKHVYYLLYNIPATVSSLAENNTTVGLFGINTVNGKVSYSPPCSQGPGAKLYVLTVYALSAEPVFTVAQSKVTMDILLAAISKTTLGSSFVNVSYTRP
jgi:phosphatidylethanolamine-binding protein (PEBP) family uncharacterized protein